jgi:hypothetical protein
LFIEKTNTNLTDTVSSVTDNTPKKVAFHHGAFSASDYSSAYSTVEAAATAGHVYSDTSTTPTYTWGTLGTISSTSTNTTYTWTPPSGVTANILMVAGGGGAGRDQAGGGGAGGLIFKTGQSIPGTKTIVIGAGGASASSYEINPGVGNNTTFNGLTALGGGAGSYGHTNAPSATRSGGSGGGGDGENRSTGAGQGQQSSSASGGYGNNSGSGQNGGGGGGGGGAGGVGSNPNGNSGGAGGDGLKEVTIGSTVYNFATLFGAIFGQVISGESWFAGGGGAGGSGAVYSSGGKGGGGDATTGSSGQVGDDGIKHTGGGGGGSWSSSLAGGSGGSGIAIFNWSGTQVGKDIAKVNDITLDPTNDSNVLISTQGTGISTVTYKVDTGSEVSTPVSQLSVAHGLAENVTGTLLAYALDVSSAQLGVKLSRSIKIPYGYETFTITQHVNASSTLSITGNGTDNITSVYKNSGSEAWDAGFYTPTFTAPITLEFNKTAPTTTSTSSIRIGITDTPNVDPSSTSMLENMSYYFRSRQTSIYQTSSSKGLTTTNGTAWNSTEKHYIVYKTNGNLEFWNGDQLKLTYAWGTGKSVRFETGHLDNSSSLNNTMTNIRMKRREWDGTKYIN